MKAIRTKYIGPSTARGSRYAATDCDGNRAVVHADNRLNSDQNHSNAAKALCVKMKWTGTYVGGWLGDTMVWVDTQPGLGYTFTVTR
jgi:hypothetical protein